MPCLQCSDDVSKWDYLGGRQRGSEEKQSVCLLTSEGAISGCYKLGRFIEGGGKGGLPLAACMLVPKTVSGAKRKCSKDDNMRAHWVKKHLAAAVGRKVANTVSSRTTLYSSSARTSWPRSGFLYSIRSWK
eukprot:gnl/TRDRNA2_/TRDRNA2_177181_c0_seq1.p1 gnl/TRDRNA2_/TRDRNA2_177181_c0~~gnl/TRDRNA2_/TRDRNA2_177181_c0_seq1.p1  ORF type:complete len:131 (+),score=14.79 gnl/TRDRNA2_/TRDRNA2_177181_c0_seq1:331-723(+)